MTEDEKKQIAVFRFGVISDFVNDSRLNQLERRRLLRGKCARKWSIPFSTKTRISRNPSVPMKVRHLPLEKLV